jgi:hypothetical protein
MPTKITCFLCNRIGQGSAFPGGKVNRSRSLHQDKVTGEQLLPRGVCAKCGALPEDEQRALHEMAHKNLLVHILTTDFGESLKDARELVANHVRVHTMRSES